MLRVLISGAGIAGSTLAYWLARYGFEATLVEHAPRLRTGGYIIDFWGLGYDIAGRMDLLPEIQNKGYVVREVRVVDRAGRKVAGFATDVFLRLTGGRFVSLARSDLAAIIFEKINGVETIFGDSIAGIQQTGEKVRVRFERGGERDFDLVFGADGLHSRVRELVFGPEDQFEKYLGIQAAAFASEGYRPKDELVYVMYTEIEKQVARFPMRDDRTMFLFTFAASGGDRVGDLAGQKALLRERFGHSDWECPQILKALDSCTDLYFDRVSQIRMNEWTRGRVALVGDAASCVSLLAGQGTALAMTAAYILAGELRKAQGNYAEAFHRYQELFGPFVRAKQQAALRFAGVFAPKSRVALFIRNQVMRMLGIPWVADRTLVSDIRDDLALPEY